MTKARVTHRDNRIEKSQLRMMVVHFMNHLINEGSLVKALDPGGVLHDLNWKSQEPKDLLALRRLLIDYIKKGMLERKDMELEIAMVAAVLWTNRLTREEHDRAIGTW